jgi:hypothetical protein
MNSRNLRWLSLALACLATIALLTSSAPLTFAQGCDDPGVCPPAVWGQNSTVNELKATFDAASRGQLGTSAPPLPNMYVGSSPTTTTPYVVPAVLLKAMAQLETKGYGGWKQFNADYGQSGYTIIGSACDIGLMQITKVTADDDALINKCNLASSWYYNLGAGARVLARKWNALALSQGGYPGGPYTVGARNPAMIEDWYYAVWAYNSFGPYYNNPANTALYQPDRPMPPNPALYDNPWHYPYQEMVWGYAIYPPSDGSTPRWDAVQLSLPNGNLFTKDQYPPNNLPRPMPAHADPHGATQLPLISLVPWLSPD